MDERRTQNGWGVAAVATGGVGLLLFPAAIVAIVCGGIGLTLAFKQPDRYGGRYASLAGLALGVASLILHVLVLLALLLWLGFLSKPSAAGSPAAQRPAPTATQEKQRQTAAAPKQPPPSQPTGDWYYDLNTGTLFTAPSGQLPPINAPSGPTPSGEPAGVRAFVFACGECANPADRFPAYLQKFTPGAKNLFDNLPDDQTNLDNLGDQVDRLLEGGEIGAGMLIADPNDLTWRPATHPASRKLMTGAWARLCPDGSLAKPCQ